MKIKIISLILIVFALWSNCFSKEEEKQKEVFEFCGNTSIRIQGTYKCSSKHGQIFFDNPYVGSKLFYFDNIESICKKPSDFYDIEKQECEKRCPSPKITNYINATCQTRKQIEKDIANIAIFSVDQSTVFDRCQLRINERDHNKDIIHNKCGLIDIESRICLETISECSGIIINLVYCKQCSEDNKSDELCNQKNSCDSVYSYDIFKKKIQCMDKCSSGEVLIGKQCMEKERCPYFIFRNSENEYICTETCPTNYKFFIDKKFQKICIPCQRMEQNGLCSDVCSDINHILIKKDEESEICVQRSIVPNLSKFRSGCYYPLVLQENECIEKCSSEYSREYLGQNLSICKRKNPISHQKYLSSDSTMWVDDCNEILEVRIDGKRKCSKCGLDASFTFDLNNNKFTCNILEISIKEIVELYSLNEVMSMNPKSELDFLDRIGRELNRLYKLIVNLPIRSFEEFYSKQLHTVLYIKTAEKYWVRRSFYQNNYKKFFYYDMFNPQSTRDFGIYESVEDSHISKFTYSSPNTGTVSVEFEEYNKEPKQHKSFVLQLELPEMELYSIKFQNIPIFYNILNQGMAATFEIQSDLVFTKSFYCIQIEIFLRDSYEGDYYVAIRKGKIENNNKINCSATKYSGIVSLTKEEEMLLESKKDQNRFIISPEISFKLPVHEEKLIKYVEDFSYFDLPQSN